MRRLLPELHEASQQEILDHVQASNRPESGNGQFVSNFVSFDDLETAIHTSCQTQVKAFYNRFYRGDEFIVAINTIMASLASMELEPVHWEENQINSFEKFLQTAAYLLQNTRC